MKVAIYRKYGPPEVLKLEEMEKPTPKDNEILIKIYAANVTSGDARMRGADFPLIFWLPVRLMLGFFKPKKQILGHDLAGIVEAIGKNVTKFQPGDEVFGTSTGLRLGSYAEYICVPEKWRQGVIANKPVNISFKQAAAIPVGGMTALYLLHKANLTTGQKILIYGASGSVGTYAVQLARNMGAVVTGVCSTSNVEMVKSLGANKVIDYTQEDFTTTSDIYDVVFEAVGKISKSKCKSVLKEKGKYVSVKMLTKEILENLNQLGKLVEDGKLKAIIDREYSLDEIIQAHRYVDTGHKKGNVIITIN